MVSTYHVSINLSRGLDSRLRGCEEGEYTRDTRATDVEKVADGVGGEAVSSDGVCGRASWPAFMEGDFHL